MANVTYVLSHTEESLTVLLLDCSYCICNEIFVDPSQWNWLMSSCSYVPVCKLICSVCLFENRRSPKHLEALTASSRCKAQVMRVYDRLRDTLYCRRSICVVSSVPLVATFERILHSLHETAVGSQPSAVVDSVSNLLNDVSMPAPGTSLRLTVPNGTIVCQRPGKHRLSFSIFSQSRLYFLPRDILTSFCAVRFAYSVDELLTSSLLWC